MAQQTLKRTQKPKQQYNRITRGPYRATLSPRESVSITGISEKSTYRMLRTGEIPHIRVGKRFLIPRAALDVWLKTAGGVAVE
jgi:excisionase family DNA binding protein